MTLLAANIGAGSTVGAAGLAYRHGLSAWWWSGSAALGCLAARPGGGAAACTRWPRRAAILTVGDFLEARFDRSVRGADRGPCSGSARWRSWPASWSRWPGPSRSSLGLPKVWGCVLAGVVLVAYFSAGRPAGRGLGEPAGARGAARRLRDRRAVRLERRRAAGAGSGPRAGPAAAAAYAQPRSAWAGAALLGLLVIFVPSFIVSPGLVQKTYGARSAAAARTAVLGNAAALAVFAFVPAAARHGRARDAARPREPGAGPARAAAPTCCRPGSAAWASPRSSPPRSRPPTPCCSCCRRRSPGPLPARSCDPAASDARLLRVSRLDRGRRRHAPASCSRCSLPSVADALKAFYGVMTAALFVPVMAGLLAPRVPRATRAGGSSPARS